MNRSIARPSRRGHIAAVALLLLGTVLASTPTAAQQPFDGTETGLACDDDRAPRACSGFLASFDGTALDVDLALPASGPYPLVVVVHGWGGSKGGPGPSSSYPGDQALTDRGFAVMRYSTRGFGKSWGQTHLASVEVEIRDLQALVSAVVDDPRFAVRPDRIGVTGASYGGGHSWLIASRPRWTSPRGTAIRVAAVAPIVPWTDLASSLIPNGRPMDSRAVVGTGKESYVTALFATGLRRDPERPYPSYIPLLPTLYARFLAGEPYETDDARDPVIEDGLRELTELRSVAWQHQWLQDLRRDRSAWVPVLNVQGWTDDLFPATEAIRMYRILRDVSPGYPIKLYFGDLGHPRARNKPAETELVLRMLLEWFDHWLLDAGPRPTFDVTSATTVPGDGFDPSLLVRAPHLGALANRTARFSEAGPLALTNHPADPAGPAADPVVRAAAAALVDPLAPRMVETAALVPGSVTIARPVDDVVSGPGGGLWYVGTGSVRLRGVVAGTDAQYDVRLWDRDREAMMRLVDRGTYKYVGPPGRVDLEIPLFGNAWLFEPGHDIVVEVTNSDPPFLRANNLPSATVLDEVTVELPRRVRG